MVHKLGGGRMKPADFEIPRSVAKAPAGTTLEQVMSATYWQNYSGNLQVGSHITVLSDDYSLHVELMVLDINQLRCKTRLLHVHAAPDAEEFDGDANQGVDGLSVKWCGPNGRFKIISNGEPLDDEGSFHTKEAAQERMAVLAAG